MRDEIRRKYNWLEKLAVRFGHDAWAKQHWQARFDHYMARAEWYKG